ncbi:hypothetical protein N9W60_02095 [Flavobacteriaceae bacterium]|nr:hypothetical protein [Flavobacteriaceae bacterium]
MSVTLDVMPILDLYVGCWNIQEFLGLGVAKQQRYIQVSTQEIGNIKNPLDDFYKAKSSTIHADLGSIVEQNKNRSEINTP